MSVLCLEALGIRGKVQMRPRRLETNKQAREALHYILRLGIDDDDRRRRSNRFNFTKDKQSRKTSRKKTK